MPNKIIENICDWECPKCGLIISVSDLYTLEVDKTVHLYKHETDG